MQCLQKNVDQTQCHRRNCPKHALLKNTTTAATNGTTPPAPTSKLATATVKPTAVGGEPVAAQPQSPVAAAAAKVQPLGKGNEKQSQQDAVSLDDLVAYIEGTPPKTSGKRKKKKVGLRFLVFFFNFFLFKYLLNTTQPKTNYVS